MLKVETKKEDSKTIVDLYTDDSTTIDEVKEVINILMDYVAERGE